MLSTTYSALLKGLETIKITIEIALTPGLPSLQIVGLPSQTIDESKERITAALAYCGIKPKAQRTVVNLAPADIRKNSSAFELPITAGLLHLYGLISPISPDTLLLGELSLTGELKPITGALPLILGAKRLGFTTILLPAANSLEASLVAGICCIPIQNLQQFISHQQGKAIIPPLTVKLLAQIGDHHTATSNYSFTNTRSGEKSRENRNSPDSSKNPVLPPNNNHVASSAISQTILFEEIIGQDQAKRALEIAAAGGHNVYLLGPPGTGKSMLAESFAALLPPLTQEEAVEVYSLHSIAGKIRESSLNGGTIANSGTTLTSTRPFRKIHHTISQVGLIGGGSQLTPGEISLAHRGVLFMDELPEFPRHILESLRQPLESKTITISRASGTVQYPANFTLIAAANPCPCGYKNSQKKSCVCSEYHQKQYTNRISGPLLDRMDLTTWVGEVSIMQLGKSFSSDHTNNDRTKTALDTSPGTSSATAAIKQRILAARLRQADRFKNHPHLTTNTDMTTQDIKYFCKLEPAARHLLIRTAEKHNLSARQYFRVIKVAQTCADLAGEERIKQAHIEAALLGLFLTALSALTN